MKMAGHNVGGSRAPLSRGTGGAQPLRLDLSLIYEVMRAEGEAAEEERKEG